MNAALARTLCAVMGHRMPRWQHNHALGTKRRTCKRCAATETGKARTPIMRKREAHTGPLPNPPF